MIDVMNEELINFREAAALPPFRRDGRPAHVSTIFRFAQRGARSSAGIESVRQARSRVSRALRQSFEQIDQITG